MTAKEKGLTPEIVLSQLREYTKSRIDSPEKTTHFHRTILENFADIAEMGALLSRSEVKKRKPEKEMPGWSASDDVMMTRDKYHKGEMYERGLTPHGVGASGRGITLVLRPEIIKLDNYDATCNYPTVSDAPIKKVCETILVNSEEDREKAQSLLEENSLSIPIAFQDKWESEHYKKV